MAVVALVLFVTLVTARCCTNGRPTCMPVHLRSRRQRDARGPTHKRRSHSCSSPGLRPGAAPRRPIHNPVWREDARVEIRSSSPTAPSGPRSSPTQQHRQVRRSRASPRSPWPGPVSSRPA